MSSSTIQLDVHMDEEDLLRELRSDVARGLSATPCWLSPRWFYDATGSQLFDEITRLPEYHLTRAETQILTQRATELAAHVGSTTLVELGSGYSTKTRLLLDALDARGDLRGIVTLDVSSDALLDAARELEQRYANVPLHAIVGDYGRHLDAVPAAAAGSRRMLVFLGSTIGNLIPAERAEFLDSCARMLAPGEHFVVGTDIVRDRALLEAAYDDAAGVTARFNRNVLEVIRARLGATLEPDAFAHEARWCEQEQWVQIALRATRATTIDVPGLVRRAFAPGDAIQTEVSAKFTPGGIARELDAAGCDVLEQWLDDEQRFALTLARRR